MLSMYHKTGKMYIKLGKSKNVDIKNRSEKRCFSEQGHFARLGHIAEIYGSKLKESINIALSCVQMWHLHSSL